MWYDDRNVLGREIAEDAAWARVGRDRPGAQERAERWNYMTQAIASLTSASHGHQAPSSSGRITQITQRDPQVGQKRSRDVSQATLASEAEGSMAVVLANTTDMQNRGVEYLQQALDADDKLILKAKARCDRLIADKHRAGAAAEAELIQLCLSKVVYLGEVSHPSRPELNYRSMTRTISSSRMNELIRTHAKTWTNADFQHMHQFHRFFEPIPSRSGFQLRAGFKLDVDHILPAAWGGVDHPRNYVFIASSINRSFGDDVDAKMGLLGVHVKRKAQEFARSARAAGSAGVERWIQGGMSGS